MWDTILEERYLHTQKALEICRRILETSLWLNADLYMLGVKLQEAGEGTTGNQTIPGAHTQPGQVFGVFFSPNSQDEEIL